MVNNHSYNPFVDGIALLNMDLRSLGLLTSYDSWDDPPSRMNWIENSDNCPMKSYRWKNHHFKSLPWKRWLFFHLKTRIVVPWTHHSINSITGWWFGCHFFYFPRNIGQLTFIFFRGVALAHQLTIGITTKFVGHFGWFSLRPISTRWCPPRYVNVGF